MSEKLNKERHGKDPWMNNSTTYDYSLPIPKESSLRVIK